MYLHFPSIHIVPFFNKFSWFLPYTHTHMHAHIYCPAHLQGTKQNEKVTVHLQPSKRNYFLEPKSVTHTHTHTQCKGPEDRHFTAGMLYPKGYYLQYILQLRSQAHAGYAYVCRVFSVDFYTHHLLLHKFSNLILERIATITFNTNCKHIDHLLFLFFRTRVTGRRAS